MTKNEAWRELLEYQGKTKLSRKTIEAITTAMNLLETEDLLSEKDLVEVVRCGECKHIRPSTETNRFYCSYKDDGEYWIETYKDDFCSYGERRDNDAKE